MKIAAIQLGVFLMLGLGHAHGNGWWYTENEDEDESGSPISPDPSGYAYSGTVTNAGSTAKWARDIHRNVGVGASRTADALVQMTQSSPFVSVTKDTGPQWLSKGFTKRDVMWYKDTCPGGDAASQCHGHPADNYWQWEHDADLVVEGELWADNTSPTNGKAEVFWTATMLGSGKSDIDVKLNGSAHLDEGATSVSFSVGTSSGMQASMISTSRASISGTDTDSAGDTESFAPGTFIKVRGTAGAKAGIVDSANKAFISAATMLQNWDMSITEGGSHDSGCSCSNKPHSHWIGPAPADLSDPEHTCYCSGG